VTTCECCGKSNLKLTVILTNGETEVRYGRDCAARVLAPVCRNGQVVGSYITALKVQRMAENAEYERGRADRLCTPNPEPAPYDVQVGVMMCRSILLGFSDSGTIPHATDGELEREGIA
jgi:hypothetical protein